MKRKNAAPMVVNMTRFPVITSAQAPHFMASVCARTIGSPKAEMTSTSVTKIEVSAHALLAKMIHRGMRDNSY